MSVKVRTKAGRLEAVLVSLNIWSQWLRPGVLALRLGQVRSALMAPYEEVQKQRQALIQELAVRENDEIKTASNGGVEFGDNAAEFDRRHTELLEAEVVVVLPFLLTALHVENTEKNYRKVRDDEVLPAVDYAALLSVMEETADIVTD